MNEPKNLDVIMNLITYGGDAKGNAIEAIQAAKNGDIELAREKISAAEKSLLIAHQSQTGLLSSEAAGDSSEISLLMIHGQDHLMTSICFKDLAIEIVDLYGELLALKKQ